VDSSVAVPLTNKCCKIFLKINKDLSSVEKLKGDIFNLLYKKYQLFSVVVNYVVE
jgi:hypothetical protein